MENKTLTSALGAIKKLESDISVRIIHAKKQAEEEILKIRENGIARIHSCKKELADNAQKRRKLSREIIMLKVKQMHEDAEKEQEEIIRHARKRSDKAVKMILERLLA